MKVIKIILILLNYIKLNRILYFVKFLQMLINFDRLNKIIKSKFTTKFYKTT